MRKQYYVYVLASKRNGTIYIGITSNLIQRVWQHKEKFIDGFTKKYYVNKLVYFEAYDDVEQAILRAVIRLALETCQNCHSHESGNPGKPLEFRGFMDSESSSE